MEKIEADNIIHIIGPNAKIGVGNACAEPQTLIDSLIKHKSSFDALEIYGMIHYWTERFVKHNLGERFRLKVFMVDRFTVEGIKKGYTEYIPCRYSEIPKLFLSGHICLDVALISISPPNSNGNCSFGVSSDFTIAMAKSAKTVIAEVNHQMPWVYGDNLIHIDEIDFAFETDRPLPQVYPEELTELDRQVGGYASQLIEDGATIQIGLGRLSEAVLSSLFGKRWLGIHSGLLPEGIVDLVEKGVIDNSCKGLKNGRIITTTIIGTDKLFKFVHNNRTVEAYPSNYTHNLVTLAKINKLHSINSAIQVDLTGQINAETIGNIQVSGVGGQSDFVCGAALSKGGKSIIVISSASTNEKRSRIVPCLDRGASVTSLRHDIDHVVTEYGIASLRGKTLHERAKALINIAHPKFRDWLESERRRLSL
ncbi:MAG: acetyl-CoA hydrolase/transferase family protein [Proteobacteria bacterium]|jgi:4-hydroxybutyrate CoA-transferase|nr:acetyl-CoA hydrolase/transferase family protein [Pseudomonadota bacterium]